MILYHATTPKRTQRYHHTGYIKQPVRGFSTVNAAMAWSMKTGRTVILQIEAQSVYKLPDHHNQFGTAWWTDENVYSWTCYLNALTEA